MVANHPFSQQYNSSHVIPLAKESFRDLQETITSTSSVAQALSRALAESQRNRSGVLTGGSDPSVTQVSKGPVATLLEKVCTSQIDVCLFPSFLQVSMHTITIDVISG